MPRCCCPGLQGPCQNSTHVDFSLKLKSWHVSGEPARPNKNPYTSQARRPAGPGAADLFSFRGPAGRGRVWIIFRGPGRGGDEYGFSFAEGPGWDLFFAGQDEGAHLASFYKGFWRQMLLWGAHPYTYVYGFLFGPDRAI